MKRVFTKSSDVIHLFAQRTQDDARCGNVYFDDKDHIYSYGRHYLLGRFLDDNAIFINDDGYSVTTSKHISEISYATRQYKQFYKSRSDLKTVYESVKHNALKLSKARKPELYINEILSLASSLDEYLRYTKTISKAKKTKEYRYIAKIAKGVEENWSITRDALAKAEKQRLEQVRKSNAKKLKESLQKFNDYDINYFRIGDEDYLRLSKCGEYVETSQNIKVTVKEAKLLYELIKRGTTIRGHRIGGYTVTSINGTLKIGCHNINIGSVHAIGNLL